MRSTRLIICSVVTLLTLNTAPHPSAVRPIGAEPEGSQLTRGADAPLVLAQYVRKCAQGC
jgi:hypothetical protein